MSEKRLFALAFRKYRLRSEFETIADFADALSEEGFIYEESLYYHWQKGTRTPKDRKLLLAILRLFVKKGGISNLKEANSFLSSADHGYLTELEINTLPSIISIQGPFLPPREIQNFIGREDIIKEIKSALIGGGKTVLIHGAAGTGKTALSIKIAHMLREDFPDGVLWFRLDTTTPLTILGTIANLFDQDISRMKNIDARSAFIRSLLATKKILYIFDNALPASDLTNLLPSAKDSSVLITSMSKDLAIQTDSLEILMPFSELESLHLFHNILGSDFLEKNKEQLKELIHYMKGSPLGLHIAAKQILYSSTTIQILLKQIKESNIDLRAYTYENKNILAVLNVIFNKLSPTAQHLFLSLRTFYGHDFTLNAVAFINNISISETQLLLKELDNYALIEISKKSRYRLHPFVYLFIKSFKTDAKLFIRANKYYIQFLKKTQKNYIIMKKQIDLERDTIYELIQKFYKYKVWREVLLLAEIFIPILWASGDWKAVEKLCKQANNAAAKLNDQDSKMKFWVMQTILPKPV